MTAINHDSYPDTYIRGILNTVKTIAMVGASEKENRPSYFAFKYLLERGYKMIPVNPGHAGEQMLGQRIYARLADISEAVDMVDIFRASQYALPVVQEALALNPRPQVVWMQLGIRNDEAASLAVAAGLKVGKSLAESDLVGEAKKIMDKMKARGAEVPIPVDVVCGKEFSPTAVATIKPVAEVVDDDMIFDVGPKTAKLLADRLKSAGTIVWNGPVGVFEFDQFAEGTKTLALAIAASPAFSIAGGGDTLAAVDKYGIADKVSYISTGGGAFLEFLEGKTLPAVAILEERAK